METSDVAVDGEVGRRLAGRRDEQARRSSTASADDHHQPGEMDRIAAALGGEAGDDGADQDGEEGAAFDQRVAGRQLARAQVVGQDAVFDRAEQRRDACRTGTPRRTAARSEWKAEARDREPGDADLDELEPLRHQAPCRSGRRVRRRAPERKKNGAIKVAPASVIRASESAPADLEQNDEDQRGLEEIVAERRKELAPEQRREAARRHQGRGHVFAVVVSCLGRPPRSGS